MTRAHAVGAAFGLFAVWTLATYLLEARVGTFLRPDPTSRFIYTLVANVLIGTIGAGLVIRAVVRRADLSHVTRYGVARPRQILVFVPLAAVLAGLFLLGQELPTSDPVILANASAQVLVVSLAEVVVCWAVLGAVRRNALGSGFVSAGIAVMSAAPDNAFAMRGVIQALDESGNLDRYASLQLPLLATGIAAVVVLVIADVVLIRPVLRVASCAIIDAQPLVSC